MTIQEFANQMKRKNGLSPLLQAFEALRRCNLGQLQATEAGAGWNPWMDETVQPPQVFAVHG